MKKAILFSCLVHLYYLSHLQCLCYTIVKETLSQSSSLTTTKENFQTNHHENTKSSNLLQNHHYQIQQQEQEQHQRNFSPKYHYTIDELLNTTFPTRISDDIDLDPCKTGKLLP